MRVHCYWEGKRSPYIDLCLQTIRQQCYRDCEFHIVTPETFDKYIPEGTLHPAWKDIKQLGVKSDCVRAACLALYGGMYVDADTIMLRSPVGIVDESKDCAFMTWSTPPDRVIAGYIYCRPGSPVARQWLDNINVKLAEGKTGWLDLGERCLTGPVRATPDDRLQHMPLDTFLPIEIDLHVAKFFESHDWRSMVQPHTIAFGLNHSWMTSRRPAEMAMPIPQMRSSSSVIHQLITHAADTVKPPKIAVCCVTWRRPEMLAKLIHSFEQQDYPNREMVILDDSGELTETSGDRWRIVSSPERSPSLGAKRNRVAMMVSPDVDAIVPWDDDDLAMPWALSAIAEGLKWADWVRASQVLVPMRGSLETLLPVETFWRQDKSDKMFHPAWGYSVGAFWASGGYPENVSLGEDLILARRLRDIGASEADPLQLGFSPYYLFGPWKNEHFSYQCKDYAKWADITQPKPATVAAQHPGVNLGAVPIHSQPMKRPVQKDWWEDATK